MSKFAQKTLDRWKENRKKWVEALRSGKYEQAEGSLRSKYGFCCLGVGCEVAGMKGYKPKYQDEYKYGKQAAFAPKTMMEFFGLKTEGGSYFVKIDPNNGLEKWATLYDHNDDGMPFDKIADIIESEPYGLFRETER